jgi:hypothetical protein
VFKAKSGLPMRWEDLGTVEGAFVHAGEIHEIGKLSSCLPHNRNVWPSKEEAEAALALSQLLQLRNAWNGDWRVKADGNDIFYGIYPTNYEIGVYGLCSASCVLNFKTEETAKKFLDTFRDLIETAKPLL